MNELRLPLIDHQGRPKLEEILFLCEVMIVVDRGMLIKSKFGGELHRIGRRYYSALFIVKWGAFTFFDYYHSFTKRQCVRLLRSGVGTKSFP